MSLISSSGSLPIVALLSLQLESHDGSSIIALLSLQLESHDGSTIITAT